MVPVTAQTLTHRYIEMADSADVYMKRERWADAERVIVTALKHEPANPSNWLMWSNLGVVRTHLENYAGAVEAYDIGLAGAPRSTVLYSNRAWTHLAFGHEREALEDIDRTLALDSLQSWPLKMRGLLRMVKQPDRARRDLLRADSIAPDDAAVLAALGDIDAAKGRLKEASQYYEHSLRIDNNPEVSFRLLLIMTDNDDFAEAQTRTINALARWPKDPNLHLLRALQHRRNYNPQDALREKNLAIGYGADPLTVARILGENPSK